MERSLLPAARRMGELGLSDEPPAAPATVELLPRPLAAPELVPPLSSTG
jgi:hypothetical protein